MGWREMKVRFILNGMSETGVLQLRKLFAHRLMLIQHQSYTEDNRLTFTE
jgi:hypothetical protein